MTELEKLQDMLIYIGTFKDELDRCYDTVVNDINHRITEELKKEEKE